MKTARVFLAVPLDHRIVAAACRVQKELAGLFPEMHWVAPETMHLTIRFFGDVPEAGIATIADILRQMAPRLTAFDTGLEGLGAFPSPRKASVLWLGVENHAAFRGLHDALEEPLSVLGFDPDRRPFTPHLTLGRSKQPLAIPEELLEKYRHVFCEKTEAKKLVLFESRLHPRGALHLPLATVELPPDRKT